VETWWGAMTAQAITVGVRPAKNMTASANNRGHSLAAEPRARPDIAATRGSRRGRQRPTEPGHPARRVSVAIPRPSGAMNAAQRLLALGALAWIGPSRAGESTRIELRYAP
jgi:hypothetical protein